MPPDPVRVADVKAWLAKADMDLKAAVHEMTAEPPFTGDAVFHAQQAAEKTLKAFLAWHDVPFRKIHDLSEIGRQCVSIDRSLEPLLMRAAELTQYAWKFRYPGETAEPSREEADLAISLGREVYEAVAARLSLEPSV